MACMWNIRVVFVLTIISILLTFTGMDEGRSLRRSRRLFLLFAIISTCTTVLCITWADIKIITNDFVSTMSRSLAFDTAFYQNNGLVTSITDNFNRVFGLKPDKSDNREKDNIKSENTENNNNEIDYPEVERTQTDRNVTYIDDIEADNSNKKAAQSDKDDKSNTLTRDTDKGNSRTDINKDTTQTNNAYGDTTQTAYISTDNSQPDKAGQNNTQTVKAYKDIKASAGSFYGDYMFPEPNCDGKLLVYECGATWCGGLADREKGIMSAFLLALLTGRTLVVDHRKPCDIKKFLEPNLYDWSECLPIVDTSRLKGSYMVNYIDRKGNLPKSFAGLKSGDLWKEFVVTIRVNVPLLDRVKDHRDTPVRLPWLLTAPRERVFTELMHALFKLEHSLEKHLNSFIENKKASTGCHFVGAHIRTLYLTDDEIQQVFNFLANFSKRGNVCLYVASDNSKIRDRALKKIGNTSSINRPIVHVDYSGYSCDGMYTAVFEQQILSKADTLIMTPSGYSRMAAYSRGTSENLYLFIQKTGKSGSHFEQIGLDQLAKMYNRS